MHQHLVSSVGAKRKRRYSNSVIYSTVGQHFSHLVRNALFVYPYCSYDLKALWLWNRHKSNHSYNLNDTTKRSDVLSRWKLFPTDYRRRLLFWTSNFCCIFMLFSATYTDHIFKFPVLMNRKLSLQIEVFVTDSISTFKFHNSAVFIVVGTIFKEIIGFPRCSWKYLLLLKFLVSRLDGKRQI